MLQLLVHELAPTPVLGGPSSQEITVTPFVAVSSMPRSRAGWNGVVHAPMGIDGSNPCCRRSALSSPSEHTPTVGDEAHFPLAGAGLVPSVST